MSPPRPLINPLLDAIFEAIQSSPSWRVRSKALPLVQVFYFRQMPLISDVKVVQMLEVLGKCLDDEVVEVQEMAATTLSGVLRVTPEQCPYAKVYASKKKMKNFRYPMSYEERTQESPPSSPKIVFFEDKNHKGITVMQVPNYPLVAEWGWGLLAECYQSPSNLPVKVRPSWNQWRERIVGLPKDRKLI
ncbi:hypothetical protein DFJ43DRAFT_1160531 [Lentinula guzmanii]|uniref:ARM repeat-containing protein n=1 Tax=Lentinula guzmanii TaxID=2804957 RepID=A0AA38MV39_9AGAR|nr:hypothetical protein DFJ43DRAFT_1160531 [Lentinula guzmanii]